MSSKTVGLPPTFDPKRDSRMNVRVEYKDFWDEPAKMRLDKLERAIVHKLLPVSGQRILDLGCGYGHLLVCPVCHQELTRQIFTYHCRECAASFPTENGILDFRIG